MRLPFLLSREKELGRQTQQEIGLNAVQEPKKECALGLVLFSLLT